jgi:hypothetical protein
MCKHVQTLLNNKFIVIPNYDQKTKKINVEISFYLDNEVELKLDEEYVITQIDEEHFRLTLLDTGECISNGMYAEFMGLE